MNTLLLIMAAAGICVTVGGLGLHFENKHRIEDLESSIALMDKEAHRTQRRVHVIEERDRAAADKIEIVHKYDDSGAPQFGGF